MADTAGPGDAFGRSPTGHGTTDYQAAIRVLK
jgi:hypothetical protein